MTSHAHDSHEASHGHGEHAHMPFQAHHFDDPEQQFDAGKLGIWLFLVTEVLFFSGMFCAYALYRSLHPEVFTFASQYLNETLGATNTGVLLFSSLSMAWGVRCAQMRQRTGLVICLAITLGCAAVFLGVKAIEYTHKWDMGLLPAGEYVSQFLQTAHHDSDLPWYEALSPWLYVLSAVPALCVVGFGIWYVMSVMSGNKATSEIAGPFLVTALSYFLGVFIGIVFQNAEAAAKAEHETAAHSTESHVDEHAEVAHSGDSHAENPAATAAAKLVSHVDPNSPPGAPLLAAVDQAGGAGVFFSIYYCMTGVHAVHILGGIAVLAWLLVRATKDHFNAEYFGPVDYVGLYWHLVDLIWIYLFPLLYLIK
jgi:cytochrome c oxidase subunit III